MDRTIALISPFASLHTVVPNLTVNITHRFTTHCLYKLDGSSLAMVCSQVEQEIPVVF